MEGIAQIATNWKTHRPSAHPLCGLQEHVRRATELGVRGGITVEEADYFLRVIGQIDILFHDEFEKIPDRLLNWHKMRRTCQLPPRDINRGYYFYGLLDCIHQIASFLDLMKVCSSLSRRLENVVFETKVKEFRLKAVSICSSLT